MMVKLNRHYSVVPCAVLYTLGWYSVAGLK